MTIKELENKTFFVPSFQRGYRWTEHEVSALFDDIEEFSTNEGKQRYCLQPLMVKIGGDGSYEVVDGQQRLTTIFIFLKIATCEIPGIKIPFDLSYKTREKTHQLLTNLAAEDEIDETSIDNFHITKARETINQWLKLRPDRIIAIMNIYTKLMESVYFIWYELPKDSDTIVMFTKVNMGKIPLTSAELIKALFLNRDNFRANSKTESDIEKRQIEIALEWDRIEHGLHEDIFWYFLNEEEKSGTRIDLLFELLADEYNEKLVKRISKDQRNYSFLVFLNNMKQRKGEEEAFVKELWEKVQKLFAEFRDWYDDLDKYHMIGYLIESGTKIPEIFTFTRNKRKSMVEGDLRKEISKKINLKLDKNSLSNHILTSNTKSKIRTLLLLFNIASLVNKGEKQYRFPFYIYKSKAKDGLQWDIEHIHATADTTDEPDDTLGNLTLLESVTNRSPKYAAETFNIKRNYILEKESSGLFVPLCTKNIFLKAYTDTPENMDKWEDDDKEGYLEAMEKTFKTFFTGGQ